MRFTSLVVELIRARPRLVVWIVVLAQAAIWLFLPAIFYGSPPGNLATTLAFGREYQVGTDMGPPLAFWLADIAFRAVGNHVFGVYLLAQVCEIVTFIAFYALARSIVGGPQGVLAVLLSMTVVVFSSPSVEFGPLILARPLWALLLLHSWQLIGQNRRSAWFAWSIDCGLLLLTTPAAIGMILLVTGFALATERGRRMLKSVDPIYALLVIIVLALPYLIWMLRADVLALPALPALADLKARALRWGVVLGGLIVATAAIALLAILNSRWFAGKTEDAPIINRPPVSPLARQFVYFFAFAPAIASSFVSALFNLDRAFGGAGVALLMSGLAVVVATGELIPLRQQRLLRSVWALAVAAPAALALAAALFLPWTSTTEASTSLPAAAMGRFFDDSYERRTNQRLRAVAGDPELASLIAMNRRRPHLLLDATPQRTPWLSVAKFNETGGVVVWRAQDTAGTPPPDIAQRFPDLVPEVPRSFDRLVNGRQPVLRIGWAIVRPKGT
ncbi:glycosyltransferase family 39 protein [Bradyrhizobium brasilense]|uniref:Dolichyl-phosphate-mannose-protein mannosyltransferase n=1 Tax=Bradyrhizobium brasilense TaxID=1419277 RepID=A0A1G7FCK9_9BRAD|nr:glycosyltransferase family 39 protein [Bradyrhizobium brasilense]MCC8974873.1 glycosyltransferase family 39 protein [Bradyrhizobium brasilense]SDE73617.1 Dolichyl-phosphate-mannose-protein mannosyltransferase [Bradyrhizobium brasilense]